MKKVILLMSFLSSVAFAETLKCHFTGPIGSISYSTDDNILTYAMNNSYYTDSAVVIFRDSGLEIRAADHDVRLFVNLAKKGNNGMSDAIYPYEGIYNKTVFGACFSDRNPIVYQTSP